MLLCNSPEIFTSWNFSVYLESLLMESPAQAAVNNQEFFIEVLQGCQEGCLTGTPRTLLELIWNAAGIKTQTKCLFSFLVTWMVFILKKEDCLRPWLNGLSGITGVDFWKCTAYMSFLPPGPYEVFPDVF